MLRSLTRCGLLVGLLTCFGCERDVAVPSDPADGLTAYQRTAIEMCNKGARRIRQYHKFATQTDSRKIYIGLRSPLLAETIQTYIDGNLSQTFREFVNEFAADEAAFVWQHRTDTLDRLEREHLGWCHQQDDWISSYR